MPITLTAIDGPNRGKAFEFAEHQTFLVGRSPQAHFVLPEDDPYVSRAHFLVEVNPPLCRLIDMHSRNGTFVNEERVDSRDLQNGDRVRAGRTTFQVKMHRPAHVPALTLDDVDDDVIDVIAVEPVPVSRAASVGDLSTIDPAFFSIHESTASGKANLPPLPPSLPGSSPQPQIPGYEVVRELGTGGMGMVLQARHLDSGTLVALKLIKPASRPTRETFARFVREANILKQLEHPHIVSFRDMGTVGDQLFFVMDFVDGIDAARLLKKEGPLEIHRAVRLVDQMLQALIHAHDKGFVHRDIKPANLLISSYHGAEIARLADFGLARSYQCSDMSGLTMTGACGGTPAFMAPEQIIDFRSVQPAADQYAAAATLYALLTDRPLYDNIKDNIDLLRRILNDPPVPIEKRRPELPAALAQAIGVALSAKPADRFANIAAFQRELLPFAH